jgi:hypothetical protein
MQELQLRALITVVVCGLLAGMALSWKLWTGLREFPLTPVVPIPHDVNIAMGYLALALLVFALAALLVSPRFIWAATAVGSLALLCALDQMRLQPWAIQYTGMLVVLAAAMHPRVEDKARAQFTALNACGFILAATYFWSGVQKLNPVFRDDLFPWFTQPLAGWLHVARLPYFLGYACPWAEIAIALALMFPSTRRVGAIGALGIHAFALLMLGPLGLNWNNVVWPWNVVQALAVVSIFWYPTRVEANALRRPTFAHAFCYLFFGLLPALSFIGAWDSYASMALYSGNIAKGELLFDAAAYATLPDCALQQCHNSVYGQALDIYSWSFTELNVPAYSEPRVFLQVARSMSISLRGSVDLQVVTRPTLFEPAHIVRYDRRLLAQHPDTLATED